MYTSFLEKTELLSTKIIARTSYLRFFIFGIMLSFSFAPFHMPGFAILSLGFLYYNLRKNNISSLFSGLFFGFGFFTIGVSWVYVSIHQYGHLNWLISSFLTFLFLFYLSLFPAAAAFLFKKLSGKLSPLVSASLFSAVWIISEYCRAHFLTGFPWLLIGFGQFDSPFHSLLPSIGVYGVGFLTCFSGTLLVHGFESTRFKRSLYLIFFICIIIFPLLYNRPLIQEEAKPITVGVIQANLSMRDKWDESIFWQILDNYEKQIHSLLGTDLIVMPESALPLPAHYIEDNLQKIHHVTEKNNSAVLLGIPQSSKMQENMYHNSILGLGKAKGTYIKQHLVPFGEYIPKIFHSFTNWLDIPDAGLSAGNSNQSLIKIHQKPIATLICYELAYGELLRKQLPMAEWIVSISDNGWFGHSLAMYQQQQMAQTLSLQSARYQITSNNDGLSSIIDSQGKIKASLPAFSSGILKASIIPLSGTTPWVIFGDFPILIFAAFILLFCLIKKIQLL
jgi:apolipoprotein N-acyltransferase